MATRKRAPRQTAARRRVTRQQSAKGREASNVRRKNFALDQDLIDRVKDVLGAKTETEAITRALDLTLTLKSFADEVRRGVRRAFGRGGVRHVFDDDASLDFSGFDQEPNSGPIPARPRRLRHNAR